MTSFSSDCARQRRLQRDKAYYRALTISQMPFEKRYISQALINLPPSDCPHECGCECDTSTPVILPCKLQHKLRRPRKSSMQRNLDLVLGNSRKCDRLLVPDLATEWFRKQKLFLDTITEEDLQSSDTEDYLNFKKRISQTLNMRVINDKEQRELELKKLRKEAQQHAEQSFAEFQLDIDNEAHNTDRHKLRRRHHSSNGKLERHKTSGHDGATGKPVICPRLCTVCKKCCASCTAEPPDPLPKSCECKQASKEVRFTPSCKDICSRQLQKVNSATDFCKCPNLRMNQFRLFQNEARSQPLRTLGGVETARSCRCASMEAAKSELRTAMRRPSCTCRINQFQADGQPLAKECLPQEIPSKPRMRRVRDLDKLPQRRFHPKCFRRISPEFYSMLKTHEDEMTDRYPLYGVPTRYWKTTEPCCPCEVEIPENECLEPCLGDESTASPPQPQKVESHIDHAMEELLERLRQKQEREKAELRRKWEESKCNDDTCEEWKKPLINVCGRISTNCPRCRDPKPLRRKKPPPPPTKWYSKCLYKCKLRWRSEPPPWPSQKPPQKQKGKKPKEKKPKENKPNEKKPKEKKTKTKSEKLDKKSADNKTADNEADQNETPKNLVKTTGAEKKLPSSAKEQSKKQGKKEWNSTKKNNLQFLQQAKNTILFKGRRTPNIFGGIVNVWKNAMQPGRFNLSNLRTRDQKCEQRRNKHSSGEQAKNAKQKVQEAKQSASTVTLCPCNKASNETFSKWSERDLQCTCSERTIRIGSSSLASFDKSRAIQNTASREDNRSGSARSIKVNCSGSICSKRSKEEQSKSIHSKSSSTSKDNRLNVQCKSIHSTTSGLSTSYNEKCDEVCKARCNTMRAYMEFMRLFSKRRGNQSSKCRPKPTGRRPSKKYQTEQICSPCTCLTTKNDRDKKPNCVNFSGLVQTFPCSCNRDSSPSSSRRKSRKRTASLQSERKKSEVTACTVDSCQRLKTCTSTLCFLSKSNSRKSASRRRSSGTKAGRSSAKNKQSQSAACTTDTCSYLNSKASSLCSLAESSNRRSSSRRRSSSSKVGRASGKIKQSQNAACINDTCSNPNARTSSVTTVFTRNSSKTRSPSRSVSPKSRNASATNGRSQATHCTDENCPCKNARFNSPFAKPTPSSRNSRSRRREASPKARRTSANSGRRKSPTCNKDTCQYTNTRTHNAFALARSGVRKLPSRSGSPTAGPNRISSNRNQASANERQKKTVKQSKPMRVQAQRIMNPPMKRSLAKRRANSRAAVETLPPAVQRPVNCCEPTTAQFCGSNTHSSAICSRPMSTTSCYSGCRSAYLTPSTCLTSRLQGASLMASPLNLVPTSLTMPFVRNTDMDMCSICSKDTSHSTECHAPCNDNDRTASIIYSKDTIRSGEHSNLAKPLICNYNRSGPETHLESMQNCSPTAACLHSPNATNWPSDEPETVQQTKSYTSHVSNNSHNLQATTHSAGHAEEHAAENAAERDAQHTAEYYAERKSSSKPPLNIWSSKQEKPPKPEHKYNHTKHQQLLRTRRPPPPHQREPYMQLMAQQQISKQQLKLQQKQLKKQQKILEAKQKFIEQQQRLEEQQEQKIYQQLKYQMEVQNQHLRYELSLQELRKMQPSPQYKPQCQQFCQQQSPEQPQLEQPLEEQQHQFQIELLQQQLQQESSRQTQNIPCHDYAFTTDEETELQLEAKPDIQAHVGSQPDRSSICSSCQCMLFNKPMRSVSGCDDSRQRRAAPVQYDDVSQSSARPIVSSLRQQHRRAMPKQSVRIVEPPTVIANQTSKQAYQDTTVGSRLQLQQQQQVMERPSCSYATPSCSYAGASLTASPQMEEQQSYCAYLSDMHRAHNMQQEPTFSVGSNDNKPPQNSKTNSLRMLFNMLPESLKMKMNYFQRNHSLPCQELHRLHSQQATRLPSENSFDRSVSSQAGGNIRCTQTWPEGQSDSSGASIRSRTSLVHAPQGNDFVDIRLSPTASAMDPSFSEYNCRPPTFFRAANDSSAVRNSLHYAAAATPDNYEYAENQNRPYTTRGYAGILNMEPSRFNVDNRDVHRQPTTTDAYEYAENQNRPYASQAYADIVNMGQSRFNAGNRDRQQAQPKNKQPTRSAKQRQSRTPQGTNKQQHSLALQPRMSGNRNASGKPGLANKSPQRQTRTQQATSSRQQPMVTQEQPTPRTTDSQSVPSQRKEPINRRFPDNQKVAVHFASNHQDSEPSMTSAGNVYGNNNLRTAVSRDVAPIFTIGPLESVNSYGNNYLNMISSSQLGSAQQQPTAAKHSVQVERHDARFSYTNRESSINPRQLSRNSQPPDHGQCTANRFTASTSSAPSNGEQGKKLQRQPPPPMKPLPSLALKNRQTYEQPSPTGRVLRATTASIALRTPQSLDINKRPRTESLRSIGGASTFNDPLTMDRSPENTSLLSQTLPNPTTTNQNQSYTFRSLPVGKPVNRPQVNVSRQVPEDPPEQVRLVVIPSSYRAELERDNRRPYMLERTVAQTKPNHSYQ